MSAASLLLFTETIKEQSFIIVHYCTCGKSYISVLEPTHHALYAKHSRFNLWHLWLVSEKSIWYFGEDLPFIVCNTVFDGPLVVVVVILRRKLHL